MRPGEVVLHDPRVVASYLGTSDTALARSGTEGLLQTAAGGPDQDPDVP